MIRFQYKSEYRIHNMDEKAKKLDQNIIRSIIPSLTVEAIKKPAKGWNLNP